MSELILILLGLLLPSQLGLHLWPSWSYVYGLRIDYLSPTIYLTDLLLVLLLLVNLKKLLTFFTRHLPVILIGLVYIVANVALSVSPPVTLIAWFRLLLLLNLILWLMVQQSGRLTYFFLGLSAGMIVVASLALTEFALQRSLAGFFYWLGERRFDINTPGIARLPICQLFTGNCQLLLRPYATFGHPNALGGFALAIFLLLSEIVNHKSYLLYRLARPFALLAVALSFSKAAVFTLALLYVFKRLHFNSKKMVLFSIFICLVTSLLPILTTSLTFGRSLIDRHFLIGQALQIFEHYPLFGAGLNNFVAAQGRLNLGLQGATIYLQPVHNLFLLLTSEIGTIGIFVLVFLIYKLNIDWKLKIESWSFVLSAILLTGTLDHYWLTLQQPRLLLTVIIGLTLNNRFLKFKTKN